MAIRFGRKFTHPINYSREVITTPILNHFKSYFK